MAIGWPLTIAACAMTAVPLAVASEPAYANPATPERAPAATRPLSPNLSLPRYDILRLLGPAGLQDAWPESYRVGQLRQALLDLGHGHVPTTAAVPALAAAQVQLALRLVDEFVSDRKLTDDNLIRLYYLEQAERLMAISISQVQLTPGDRVMRALLRHEGKLIELYQYQLGDELVLEELRADGTVDELRNLLGLPLLWCSHCPPTPARIILRESPATGDAPPTLRIESVEFEGVLLQPNRVR